MGRRHSYDDRRTVRGYTFGITIEPDYDAGPPWEDDWHGPVSDWRDRERKRPGERELVRDRGLARFYDVEAAQALALAEGWNCQPYDVPGETARQRAARAVDHNFRYLRDYCQDRWHYVGVVVTWIGADGAPLAPQVSASLWSVEDSDRAYLDEVADELIAECLAEIETDQPDIVLSEN